MPETREARAARLATEKLRPAGPAEGVVNSTVQAVRDIAAHRELLGLLTRREIKARYKDSSLGLVWSLIRPLVQLLVYWVAIGRFMGAARQIDEFAIFIFTGLTIWQLYSDIVATGTNSIVQNGGLIKKVYVPREIFPISAVGSALFNFAMQLIILVLFTVARSVQISITTGDPVNLFPTGTRWVYAPLALLLCVVWASAWALVLAAVNVYLRDIQYLVEVAMMVLFWASPTVYSFGMVAGAVPGWVQDIYLANPMTMAILAFQRTFWVSGDGHPFPDHMAMRLGIMIALSFVALWVAHRVFARLQSNFAQEL